MSSTDWPFNLVFVDTFKNEPPIYGAVLILYVMELQVPSELSFNIYAQCTYLSNI